MIIIKISIALSIGTLKFDALWVSLWYRSFICLGGYLLKKKSFYIVSNNFCTKYIHQNVRWFAENFCRDFHMRNNDHSYKIKQFERNFSCRKIKLYIVHFYFLACMPIIEECLWFITKWKLDTILILCFSLPKLVTCFMST